MIKTYCQTCPIVIRDNQSYQFWNSEFVFVSMLETSNATFTLQACGSAYNVLFFPAGECPNNVIFFLVGECPNNV